MKTSKPILIAVALMLWANFSSAAPQVAKAKTQTSPSELVANLYKQHKKRSPFFQTRSRALLDRYFEKTLANLILQDAIRSRGEVGAIDGDPLFNAQDMEIRKFQIHQPVYREGKADVLVSFENFGQKKEITFVLVPRRDDWRIANIKYDDGADLLGLLQSEAATPKSTRAVKVYLVAVGDNGAHGKKFGCEDSLAQVTIMVARTAEPLRAALQELLSIAPPPGLQSFWKGRNLTLRSVSIQKGTAIIHFSGEIFVAGICDEPRIVGQIEATARQFSTVKRVRVFIGKQTLAQAIR
ncbi:MAG: hypothetical protein QOD75_1032 [Blastocatellia bacterium]|jgi:hypothetical protein|nr:hypothetical protein [Blastocatellia bacterium]